MNREASRRAAHLTSLVQGVLSPANRGAIQEAGSREGGLGLVPHAAPDDAELP